MFGKTSLSVTQAFKLCSAEIPFFLFFSALPWNFLFLYVGSHAEDFTQFQTARVVCTVAGAVRVLVDRSELVHRKQEVTGLEAVKLKDCWRVGPHSRVQGLQGEGDSWDLLRDALDFVCGVPGGAVRTDVIVRQCQNGVVVDIGGEAQHEPESARARSCQR